MDIIPQRRWARNPPAAARVEVRPAKDRPRRYELVAYLRPAYQSETPPTYPRPVVRVRG